MKMTLSKHVNAPRSLVFDKASRFGQADQIVSAITRVEMLTDGPVGEGTRFRETRSMFGKEATEEMDVTAFEPPHAYTLGADSHGTRYSTRVRFEETGGGTEVVMEMHATPRTLGAKLPSPLGLLTKGVMRRCMEQDLEDLKNACESEEGPGTAPVAG